MALLDAVPPDEWMIRAHRGASGAVGLLIDSRENMKTRLTPRALIERVPFLGTMPRLRKAFGDRTLAIFHMDIGGHNPGVDDELRANQGIDIPFPVRERSVAMVLHRVATRAVNAEKATT